MFKGNTYCFCHLNCLYLKRIITSTLDKLAWIIHHVLDIINLENGVLLQTNLFKNALSLKGNFIWQNQSYFSQGSHTSKRGITERYSVFRIPFFDIKCIIPFLRQNTLSLHFNVKLSVFETHIINSIVNFGFSIIFKLFFFYKKNT